VKFTESESSAFQIQSYKENQLKVAGQTYTQPILISPNAIENWQVDITQLHLSDITAFTKYTPEVVILGLGSQFQYPREFMQRFINQGIGVEVMTTAAAVRTFNLILSEGRRVVTGLII
jgi:uncharacterized protein